LGARDFRSAQRSFDRRGVEQHATTEQRPTIGHTWTPFADDPDGIHSIGAKAKCPEQTARCNFGVYLAVRASVFHFHHVTRRQPARKLRRVPPVLLRFVRTQDAGERREGIGRLRSQQQVLGSHSARQPYVRPCNERRTPVDIVAQRRALRGRCDDAYNRDSADCSTERRVAGRLTAAIHCLPSSNLGSSHSTGSGRCIGPAPTLRCLRGPIASLVTSAVVTAFRGIGNISPRHTATGAYSAADDLRCDRYAANQANVAIKCPAIPDFRNPMCIPHV